MLLVLDLNGLALCIGINIIDEVRHAQTDLKKEDNVLSLVVKIG
jgi:hypothetical protein